MQTLFCDLGCLIIAVVIIDLNFTEVLFIWYSGSDAVSEFTLSDSIKSTMVTFLHFCNKGLFINDVITFSQPKTMKNHGKYLKKPWKPTSFGPKNVTSLTGGPTDLLWSKKRHVTNTGPQPTSFGPKNVTSLTRGANRPFRCLDSYYRTPQSLTHHSLFWSSLCDCCKVCIYTGESQTWLLAPVFPGIFVECFPKIFGN